MILPAAIVCLALNIHYEAGIDSIEGQLAVALATLNRAQHRQANVCNEVFKPGAFEWTAQIPAGPSKAQMARYKSTATVAVSLQDFTGGATHFCHYQAFCSWSVGMEFKGRYGSHNFYKPQPKKGKK